MATRSATGPRSRFIGALLVVLVVFHRCKDQHLAPREPSTICFAADNRTVSCTRHPLHLA